MKFRTLEAICLGAMVFCSSAHSFADEPPKLINDFIAFSFQFESCNPGVDNNGHLLKPKDPLPLRQRLVCGFVDSPWAVCNWGPSGQKSATYLFSAPKKTQRLLQSKNGETVFLDLANGEALLSFSGIAAKKTSLAYCTGHYIGSTDTWKYERDGKKAPN